MRINKIIIILTAIIALIFTIQSATATTWNQYTPSPTTDALVGVLALSNGESFAYTSGMNKCFLYNTTNWAEIQCPDDQISLPTYTFLDAQKTSNGTLLIAYSSTSAGYNLKVIEYNFGTGTYSVLSTTTSPDVFFTFKCIVDDDTCYATGLNNAGIRYKVYPTQQTINITISHEFLLNSNHFIMTSIRNTFDYACLYEWNGISDVSRYGSCSSNQDWYSHLYITASERAGLLSAGGNIIRWYNYSSGLFISDTANTSCRFSNEALIYFDNKIQYLSPSGKGIADRDYNTNNCHVQEISPQNLNDMDSDETTGISWAVGDNGYIYEATSGSGAYNVNPRIATSPTQYGNLVTFYGTATEPSSIASNLTLEIWDATFTTLIYTTTIPNVPSGIETALYSIPSNSPLWGQYPVGNYIYNLQGTVTDGSQTQSNSIAWSVTAPSTTNITTYTATCFNKDITGISGIYGVTAWDENHVYTSAQIISTNKPTIASFDITNPQNIQTSLLSDHNGTTISLNQISGRNGNPSGISGISVNHGLNKLYVSTNDNLFVFTNATNKQAENLLYETDQGSFGFLENHDINDVYATTTENKSWICQHGTGLYNDDIYSYDDGNQSFDQQMNSNPCLNLIRTSDGSGEYIIVHRGTNRDVQIWNVTSLSLLTTIDITKTISTYAYHDLISTSGNYLYLIAGQDEIRRYDITNKANVSLAGKCYTKNAGEQITSIEALNDDTIVFGTINNAYIYACDYTNNATYSTTKGGYEGQMLSPLLYNQAWSITKNNANGKFSIAEDTGYETCNYEKTTGQVTSNNPPVIDQITTTATTPCMNQTVQFQIIASDPDAGDTLGYAHDCNGGTPTYFTTNYEFICWYPTTGTKTITFAVQDNHGATTSSSTPIIVQNCVQTNATTILFRIIDSATANAIEGATITLSTLNNGTIGTQTTNSLGYADFTGLSYEEYRATYTMNGYIPQTQYFYPSNERYTRWLDPINGANGTNPQAVLTIMVYDKSNHPLENALVGATDIVTGESKSALTDYTGAGYILGISPSSKLLISASKEGYATSSTYASIGIGEQKTVNIIMGITTTGGAVDVTNRHCVDQIKGVMLCGNLSITGVGNSCTQDTDCISGRCAIAVSGLGRECSRFNWTICDHQGEDRNNACFMRATGQGTFRGFGDYILNNFLYVLLAIAVIIIVLMMIRAVKR
jgi:hypothetical protein